MRLLEETRDAPRIDQSLPENQEEGDRGRGRCSGGETRSSERSPAYNVGMGAGMTRMRHAGEPFFFLFLLYLNFFV